MRKYFRRVALARVSVSFSRDKQKRLCAVRSSFGVKQPCRRRNAPSLLLPLTRGRVRLGGVGVARFPQQRCAEDADDAEV